MKTINSFCSEYIIIHVPGMLLALRNPFSEISTVVSD